MNRRNDAYLMAPLRGAGNGESSSRGSSSLREEPKSEAQQHTYETQPQDGNMVEDFGEVEQNEPSARTSLEYDLQSCPELVNCADGIGKHWVSDM